jgi:hypothetical protein
VRRRHVSSEIGANKTVWFDVSGWENERGPHFCPVNNRIWGYRTEILGPFGGRVVWVPGEPGRAKRALLFSKKLRIAGAGRSTALLARGRPDFLLASRALLPWDFFRYNPSRSYLTFAFALKPL